MELGQMIWIWVGIFVVIGIGVSIKSHFDTKKGENSEEKQEIKNLVQKLIPDAFEYTAAYGFWERKNYGGGTTTITTYYTYYAVAFKPGTLWCIPLSFAGGEISYEEPFCITAENLGMVNGKKGEKWAGFYDKNNEEILHVAVVESNTKDDKYNPVNIQQKEDADAFGAFVESFMEEVNRENGVEVSGKPYKPLKKK